MQVLVSIPPERFEISLILLLLTHTFENDTRIIYIYRTYFYFYLAETTHTTLPPKRGNVMHVRRLASANYCVTLSGLKMILFIFNRWFVRRNAICGARKAAGGCLTEKACVTHGDPPGLRATVKLRSRSRAPAGRRGAEPRRFPLNNSRVRFLTDTFLRGKLCEQEPLIPFPCQYCTQMISACFLNQTYFDSIGLEVWPKGLSR